MRRFALKEAEFSAFPWIRLIVLIGLIGGAAGVLGLSGCGDEGGALPPGNLSINWMVGSSGCAQADVSEVAIFITSARSQQTDLQTFSCASGSGMLTGLQPGVYDLSLRGRDDQGVDRFGGEVLGVEVRSNGTTNVQTIRLSALPAELRISWYFENGRMCAYNGVTEVDVVLFEDEYEIYSTTADCALGVVELVDVQADTYIVDVVGVDQNGRALFSGQDEVEVGRGERDVVEVRLVALTSSRPGPNEE